MSVHINKDIVLISKYISKLKSPFHIKSVHVNHIKDLKYYGVITSRSVRKGFQMKYYKLYGVSHRSLYSRGVPRRTVPSFTVLSHEPFIMGIGILCDLFTGNR